MFLSRIFLSLSNLTSKNNDKKYDYHEEINSFAFIISFFLHKTIQDEKTSTLHYNKCSVSQTIITVVSSIHA